MEADARQWKVTLRGQGKVGKAALLIRNDLVQNKVYWWVGQTQTTQKVGQAQAQKLWRTEGFDEAFGLRESIKGWRFFEWSKGSKS